MKLDHCALLRNQHLEFCVGLAVMGKIVFKTILKIENKIVFKTILKILLQNSFQKYFEIENKIVFWK